MVHGLQIAQQNDVAIVPDVMQRGVQWLKNYQDEQVRRLQNALKKPKVDPWKELADNTDALVYMVLVDAGVKNAEMHEFLYRDRTKLAVYGLAIYGLAAEKLGDREKLAMVLQNIGQYVMQDEENQTAWLNLPESNYWWYWYGSEYEAQAYYLKLLSRTDPKGQKASRLVKYLLNNRKHATYWNSTRDTAIVVFITVAAVFIVAVLFLVLGSLGKGSSGSSSSKSKSSSKSSDAGIGGAVAGVVVGKALFIAILLFLFALIAA